jgi:hypothetical protein
MEKTVNKGTAGASLIEIMITMVLIALMLIAITSLFPRMTTYSKNMHESDIAKVIAAEVLDGLHEFSRHTDYTCPTLPDKKSTPPYTFLSDPPAIPEYLLFVNRYNTMGLESGLVKYVADWELKCTLDPKVAEVTVSWEKAGKTHNVTVIGAVR